MKYTCGATWHTQGKRTRMDIQAVSAERMDIQDSRPHATNVYGQVTVPTLLPPVVPKENQPVHSGAFIRGRARDQEAYTRPFNSPIKLWRFSLFRLLWWGLDCFASGGRDTDMLQRQTILLRITSCITPPEAGTTP